MSDARFALAALFLALAGTLPAQPTLTPYKLTVSQRGSGTGSVTSSAGAISCGTTCSSNYSPGVPVTLSARPGTGVFMGWSGDCSGTAPSCSFVMKRDINVTARFERPKVSVSRTGSARNIQVVSTPAGIDCGSLCGANFDAGTQVRLNTAGVPENLFMLFSDGRRTGYDQFALTVDAAAFEVRVTPESTVVMTAGGGNAGSVTIPEAGATCSWGAAQTTICRWPLAKGRAYTLTSSVPRTFSFAGATAQCSSSQLCPFVVPRDKPLAITVR